MSDVAASPAPADGVPDGPSAWRVALASLLLISCGMGIEYLLWSNVKTISDDMGWSRGTTSAAYALEMLGTGIGGIFMGRLCDRSGAVLVVLIGAMMIPAGALVLTHVTEPWQFCLIFGLMIGFLGNATLFAPLITTATRWFNRNRGLAVAVVASGQGIAGAIWPAVFDYLIELYGWRGSLFIYGLFAMVTMPPLVLLLKGRPPGWSTLENERKHARSRGLRFGSLAENVPLALLCAAIACCCIAMAMPLLHVASHAQDVGYTRTQGAFLLTWIMALSFIGRLGLGFFADTIGGLRAMLVGSGLQALGILVMVPFDSLWVLYLGATVFGIGFGGLVPMYAVALRSIYPPHSIGWRVGAIFLFGAIGMAVGGQMAGSFFDYAGTYRWAFLVGFGFNVVNLFLIVAVMIITRGPRRGPATEVFA
ncbi:MAG: MFS transporter [Rhodospirillaceae bacterium]|nr:MFS transporter [Rhodospirillaceae bacterium]|tara:strand:- start:7857 stop:9122 length:1266 start_codon:yes stop_codon:yes gene_type:complete